VPGELYVTLLKTGLSSMGVFTHMVSRQDRHWDVEVSVHVIIRHTGSHSVYVREGVASLIALLGVGFGGRGQAGLSVGAGLDAVFRAVVR